MCMFVSLNLCACVCVCACVRVLSKWPQCLQSEQCQEGVILLRWVGENASLHLLLVQCPRVLTKLLAIVWKMESGSEVASGSFVAGPFHVCEYKVVMYLAVLNCLSEVAFEVLWIHTCSGLTETLHLKITIETTLRFELVLVTTLSPEILWVTTL